MRVSSELLPNGSPEQKLINITDKIQDSYNKTRSTNSKDRENQFNLAASKESLDFGGDFSYEKIKQKYANAGNEVLSQSIGSDGHTEDWKKKLERMKQDLDTDNAVKRIEVEESANTLDIHSIIRKYGSSKDATWAYEIETKNDRK